MNDRFHKRLAELKREFESGQKLLAELESKQSSVRETMLRISGAIQVLEEELAKAEQSDQSDAQTSLDINTIPIRDAVQIDPNIDKMIRAD
jgi:hypothetical protein